MISFDLNWWAVLVCAVLAMVIGAMWYSNLLFAKPWMQEIGKKESELGDSNTGYVIAMVSNAILVFVLANVVRHFDAMTFWQGLGLGALMWLGFTATASAMNYAFSGKSLRLWAIDSGLQLVVLAITGAIFAIWR